MKKQSVIYLLLTVCAIGAINMFYAQEGRPGGGRGRRSRTR
ncbi:MAG: hypothetical protein AAB401_12520 [Acidobacteriota bacterium]